MTNKASPPSIRKTAFDCPHCGAFTTQYWFKIFANEMEEDSPLPFYPVEDFKERIQQDSEGSEKAHSHPAVTRR